MTTASDADFKLLFTEARTHSAFLPKPVDDSLLQKIYDTLKMAPTGGNAQPGRFLFLKSAAAKARIGPAMTGNNVEKTLAAPVVVVVAYDSEFYEKMPKLFPARDMKTALIGMPAEVRNGMARHNAMLQEAYFILAARAHGLDCGPMGGFDPTKVDAEFFPDGKWKSTLVINLGYGDPAKLFPRNPRLDFAEACKIIE